MKEINIGRAIVEGRRRKGITQEDLAQYMGVSKASVSKWETGQSYPDITLLPQLAAYFNISIDDLLGYEPQMEKDDIRRLYHRLAQDFLRNPLMLSWPNAMRLSGNTFRVFRCSFRWLCCFSIMFI